MTGRGRRGNAQPLSDVASRILDPVLRRRSGMSVALVQAWQEIVGDRLAERTRPERIMWPRRASEDDPFEAATLVIACEGVTALHVQHETGEIIARINAFLGFGAIGRIRIVQKPVAAPAGKGKRNLRELNEIEARKLASMTGDIEDDDLRKALENLGRSVMASRD